MRRGGRQRWWSDDVAPWNAKDMEVVDPFGNRRCFNEPLPPAAGG